MRPLTAFLRPVSKRPSALLARPAQTWLQPFRRRQHNHTNYGPHKEYFQTPGQAPLPDTTPYNPQEPIQTLPIDTTPSPVIRSLRSIFWATLFGTLGLAAGMAFVTWEYLQPPFPPGSPEEQDLLAEIEAILDEHPLVQDLREQKWVEEDFYVRRPSSERDQGQSFVHDTLQGSSQTLNVKVFKNPETQFSIMMFFVGFGLDGFPDVMHGGITATMMLEAMRKHVSYFASDFELDWDKSNLEVNYKVAVRPGQIYTIMVPPGTVEPQPDNHSKNIVRFVTIMLDLDKLPELSTQLNPADKTMQHTINIHAARGSEPYIAFGNHTIPVIELPDKYKKTIAPLTVPINPLLPPR